MCNKVGLMEINYKVTSTGAEEDLHCRSEAEHQSAGAKEVNPTLGSITGA